MDNVKYIISADERQMIGEGYKMKKRVYGLDILVALTIVLLFLVTFTGLMSFRLTNSYLAANQYGEEIKIFGSGIYAHDSYFKAPIFIGSDAPCYSWSFPCWLSR
jgi:hypothetical protein